MNIQAMMKKAQEMQKKMQEAQEKIADITEEGTAGGGMVTVTLNGKHVIKKVSISDDLMKVDEKDMLEDLIMAAHNDAHKRIEERTSEEMQKVTGGMGLPGNMQLPF